MEKLNLIPKQYVEYLKIFFASLATNLVKNLPLPTHNFGESTTHLNIHNKNFSLKATNHEVVLKMLEEINPSKAMGIDNIGGKFLKDGASILAELITKLCNLSTRMSKFPTKKMQHC